MMRRRMLLGAFVPVALTIGRRARAADGLRLAVGQKGNWDTSVAELGQRAGIFRKHDLELDILYTQGSGETLQAVLSRSAEIGVGGGTLGAMGAFSKGAPMRIIASEATGAGDLFWYVRADSPIKSIKETAGKTVAYSTQGSSTNSVVLGFVDTFAIKPDLVSTGGIPGTFTQVMSGQIDVGWSAAPYLLDAAEEGKIRIIANGNDVPPMRTQTVRVNVAHAAVLAARMPVLQRFTAGYRETVQWMYRSPDAARAYAEFAGVQERLVKRLRDEFFANQAIWSDYDHRPRFADGRCGTIQVHACAADQDTVGGADPNSERVTYRAAGCRPSSSSNGRSASSSVPKPLQSPTFSRSIAHSWCPSASRARSFCGPASGAPSREAEHRLRLPFIVWRNGRSLRSASRARARRPQLGPASRRRRTRR